MPDARPQLIHRRDYRPPDFLIRHAELDFQLHEECALVGSRLRIHRRPGAPAGAPLLLHGRELELLELAVDGAPLAAGDFSVDDECLRVHEPPGSFLLQCRTRIHPRRNTSLEGLYESRGMFCTQCEAEGFRKLTYYLDRPDVMATFTVRIEAERARYPVLLSNGNLLREGAAGGRHWALWRDPFPKPSYLFALVAGDLELVRDRFTTRGGREVDLRIHVEAKDLDKCEHAMRSLKAAMRWDELAFGREYDLDIFNIVAVDDFNMGAMENKSLNIFNTSCVLCSPEVTTDADFQRVESVVAHEYFHNWSGNRVTCRDWFQLSLKEGFTVFREAEFAAARGSPAARRIEDVALLRSVQFAEDAGPMAHPVRPDSYMEIGNFYTATVYEKGAEVVRMLRTLLGPEPFRAGCDRYFARHDGQAVTCDDFVDAMAAASGRDLGQFRRWYSQAGTPRVEARGEWDASQGRYVLSLRQSTPPTPGQERKAPLPIPVAVGLLGESGALPLQLLGAPPGGSRAGATTMVLELSRARQRFTFAGLAEKPVPSLLRGFSAPVHLSFPYTDDELIRLMLGDDDGFCRWDAAQRLATRLIERLGPDASSAPPAAAPASPDATAAPFAAALAAFGALLADTGLDAAVAAAMLRPPSVDYLMERSPRADVPAIFRAREAFRQSLAAEREVVEADVAQAAPGDPPCLRAVGRGRFKRPVALQQGIAQRAGEALAERLPGAENRRNIGPRRCCARHRSIT